MLEKCITITAMAAFIAANLRLLRRPSFSSTFMNILSSAKDRDRWLTGHWSTRVVSGLMAAFSSLALILPVASGGMSGEESRCGPVILILMFLAEWCLDPATLE